MRASVLGCVILACTPAVSGPPPEVAEEPVSAAAESVSANSGSTSPAGEKAAEAGEGAPGNGPAAGEGAPGSEPAAGEGAPGSEPAARARGPVEEKTTAGSEAAAAGSEAAAEEKTAGRSEAAPLRPQKTWPFFVWDRAEAITYNHVPYGPGIPLRVYDEQHGWSPNIVERRPMTREQAERTVGWVGVTSGEVEISKCAFPRHAVVLYAGETPVASINVCFECGDILVWPEFDPKAKSRNKASEYKKKLAGYKKVYPQWERLFRDEVGFSLTPHLRP